MKPKDPGESMFPAGGNGPLFVIHRAEQGESVFVPTETRAFSL